MNRKFTETLSASGACLLLAAAFLYLYREVLWALIRQWMVSPMYSYGFFIPAISLYLAYDQRHKLVASPAAPSYKLGVVILLPGLAVFLLGSAGGVMILKQLTLPVSLMGGVGLLWGWDVLKVLLLPLSYLYFMIPFWEVITGPFHRHLQIFSAWMGVELLDLVHVPVHLRGVYIDLPRMTLEVADVCSGVNYLIAIVAVGVPLSLLHLKGWGSRVALLVCAVVIAVVANGFRVALIGFWSYRNQPLDVHGPFHILQGLFVSMVGYAVLFLGVWILSLRQDAAGRPGGDGASGGKSLP